MKEQKIGPVRDTDRMIIGLLGRFFSSFTLHYTVDVHRPNERPEACRICSIDIRTKNRPKNENKRSEVNALLVDI